jgi:RhoGAP domain
MWGESYQKMVCVSCVSSHAVASRFPDRKFGFEKVTLLMQFIFLLRVALARLGSILRENKGVPHTSGNSHHENLLIMLDDPNLTRYDSSDGVKPEAPRSLASIRSLSFVGEEEAASYAKTMDGVRRMRSSHLDQRLMNSAQHARQSRIIDGPEADHADPGTAKGSPVDTTDNQYLQPAHPSRRHSTHSERHFKIVDEEASLTPPRALGDERALTLDDLPKILAAEHAKEKERPSHSSRQPSTNSYEFNFMAPDPVEDFTLPLNEEIAPREANVKYFSELSALEYFIVRHVAVLALETLLGEIFNLEELLELIETRKGTIWERFGKAFRSSSADKKGVKKKGVFGIPIEVLCDRNGSDSVMGSGPGSLRIPAFVDDAISTMRQMGMHPQSFNVDMSVEGVFRKNGNIRRLKELADAFDKQAQAPSLDDENPVQLAALLKKFLREMPDPLLTFKLQRLWLASQSRPSQFAYNRSTKLTNAEKSVASHLLFTSEISSGYHGSCLFVFVLGGFVFACRRGDGK